MEDYQLIEYNKHIDDINALDDTIMALMGHSLDIIIPLQRAYDEKASELSWWLRFLRYCHTGK